LFFLFSSAPKLLDLSLQKGDAPAQNLVAALLAFGIPQLIGHLERIDAQIMRSHVVATEALNFPPSVPLQISAHAFRLPTQGHSDIAVTDPHLVGQHNSIIAQIETL
jgi:hypothetical protein